MDVKRSPLTFLSTKPKLRHLVFILRAALVDRLLTVMRMRRFVSFLVAPINPNLESVFVACEGNVVSLHIID
jgi:hypothetical protein